MRRRLALLLLPALVGLACSSDNSVSEAPAAPEPTTTAVAAPSTTPPLAEADEPTTVLTKPEPVADSVAGSGTSGSGTVFPGREWETGPLPPGVDRAGLDAAVDRAFGTPDNAARVRSVLVVEAGRLVYERYHPLDTADTVMPSFSVAKSFTSAVTGLLVADGRLAVDEPAPVAAWADPKDPRHEITIADLLHMSSGLEWVEMFGPNSLLIQMFEAPVASEFAANLPLVAEPGSQFKYSTGTTAILAGIITDELGGPAAADAYIAERLLDPIGITSTEFGSDPAGRWLGGIGANSTPRDFARFGWLYANRGGWAGEQIIPEEWVEFSRAPSPANPQYGAQWWLMRPDAFEARGLFGQLVIVAPDHELVIVITTNPGGDADTLAAAVYEAFTGLPSPS